MAGAHVGGVTGVQVRRCLAELMAEPRSTSELRLTIELLIKVTRNVIPPKDPGTFLNPKFAQINPANTEFNKNIWQSPAARRIILMSGWVRVGEGDNLRLVRAEDAENGKYISVQELIDILIENRRVVPSEAEWVPQTKVEKILTTQEKFRLEQLEHVEKRKVEYEKALKEKKELKEMGERCKKEQRADQAYRNMKNPPIHPDFQNKAFELRLRGASPK